MKKILIYVTVSAMVCFLLFAGVLSSGSSGLLFFTIVTMAISVVTITVAIVRHLFFRGEGTGDATPEKEFQVSEEFYGKTLHATAMLEEFVTELAADKTLRDIAADIVSTNINIQGRLVTDSAEKLKYLAFADMVKCFRGLGCPPDMDRAESLGLLLYAAWLLEPDYTPKYSTVSYMVNTVRSFAGEVSEQLDKAVADMTTDKFFIPACLQQSDRHLLERYVITLYRFASVVADGDGGNGSGSDGAEFLGRLVALKGGRLQGEAGNGRNGTSPYDELESLIGLQSVKREISSLANFVKVQRMREDKGMKTSPVSYHCVFTGNPGTGKTTVARIVAGIYKDLGILETDKLVETDRSGLVAEYVGQTAVKTNKIIDSALDGVLFIDEAYSLVCGGGGDYGQEAVATLLKRMEDDRNRLVVILAGYSEEMKNFIDSNPGLQSRFNRYVEFPDYSADELETIFSLKAEKYEYILTDGAKTALKSAFTVAAAAGTRSFGNARFVRNLFEKTIVSQANRLSRENVITSDALKEIREEDVARALCAPASLASPAAANTGINP